MNGAPFSVQPTDEDIDLARLEDKIEKALGRDTSPSVSRLADLSFDDYPRTVPSWFFSPTAITDCLRQLDDEFQMEIDIRRQGNQPTARFTREDSELAQLANELDIALGRRSSPLSEHIASLGGYVAGVWETSGEGARPHIDHARIRRPKSDTAKTFISSPVFQGISAVVGIAAAAIALVQLVLPITLGGHALPLHPVIVSLPIVLSPLALILSVCFCVPRTRSWARYPMVLVALGGWLAMYGSFVSGETLQEHLAINDGTLHSALIASHARLAGQLLWLDTAYLALAVIAVVFVPRLAKVRDLTIQYKRVLALTICVFLLIAATLASFWTIRVGELGTRAHWDPTISRPGR